jgi:hypothetical protein
MYQFIVSASNCNLIPDTAFVKLNVVKDTKIQIISPSKAKKDKPVEIKSENVNVSWRCLDCDENTNYTVNVSGLDGNKHKDKRTKLKNNSASFNLPSGKYKITVSGTNGASSDTTYIVVNTGGGAGWFIGLLLLVAVGVGIYFLLKKMKGKNTSSNHSDDYSGGKKSSNNQYSDNNSNDSSDDGMF